MCVEKGLAPRASTKGVVRVTEEKGRVEEQAQHLETEVVKCPRQEQWPEGSGAAEKSELVEEGTRQSHGKVGQVKTVDTETLE